MVALLLSKGRLWAYETTTHAATPLQWAVTAGSSEVVEYLKSLPIGVFDAVVAENHDRLKSLLDDDPSSLESTSVRSEAAMMSMKRIGKRRWPSRRCANKPRRSGYCLIAARARMWRMAKDGASSTSSATNRRRRSPIY